ncbi:MAG: hypothetical protein M3O24_00445 [Thermoproteota archaeon]|nr:hypothetical protein [Thermoproteota archaeon]
MDYITAPKNAIGSWRKGGRKSIFVTAMIDKVRSKEILDAIHIEISNLENWEITT